MQNWSKTKKNKGKFQLHWYIVTFNVWASIRIFTFFFCSFLCCHLKRRIILYAYSTLLLSAENLYKYVDVENEKNATDNDETFSVVFSEFSTVYI